MKFVKTTTTILGLSLILAACSTRPEQSAGSAFNPNEQTTQMPVIEAVLNLTPEAQGFVRQQLSASKSVRADAQNYQAVVINAQAYTDSDVALAREALKAQKRIIIDSSTGSVQDSQDLQKDLVGASIGSAAVVITNFGEGHLTVTPLEQSSGVSRQGDSGAAENNSVQNVLGLE